MDYKKIPVSELRKLASEKGIKDAADMKKKDLQELLEKIDLMMQSKSKPEEKIEEKNRTQAEETRTVRNEERPRTQAEEPRNEERAKTQTDQPRTVRTEERPRTDYVKRERTEEEFRNKSETPAYEEASVSSNAQEKPEAEKKTQPSFDGQDYNPALNSGKNANGILEVIPDGFGFLRSDNYMPGDRDIYISPSQIRRFGLRTGDIVKGPIRTKQQNEKFSALLYIESVNGFLPSQVARRKQFESLTPIFPDERIRLDYDNAPKSLRIVDLFSPIGKGQRGMIVSPPKAGKTTLLKQIAKRISVAYPEMNLLVLLIDERPEEVTDIKESIEGKNVEVIYSTFDELPEHHKRVSEMVIERAKRLVESKKDVVILIDSITRLSRAYNLTVQGSGRTLSGGLDPTALHMPKKFFGAARNMREGGSLTILATALVETGSRMDDVVFEEFKGTGNMELVLNRNLSEKRIFPAIDLAKSGTRKDDLLLDKDEQEVLDMLRAQLRGLKTDEMTEDIIKLISRTKNNKEFLDYARKSFQRRPNQ